MKHLKSLPRLAFGAGRPLPSCRSGEQVTIRVGPKWSQVFHNSDERHVVLLDGYGEPFALAELRAAYYVLFHELKPEWLVHTYDPAARTLAGMLDALQEVYGNAKDPGRRVDITADTYVTVLFFEVL